LEPVQSSGLRPTVPLLDHPVETLGGPILTVRQTTQVLANGSRPRRSQSAHRMRRPSQTSCRSFDPRFGWVTAHRSDQPQGSEYRLPTNADQDRQGEGKQRPPAIKKCPKCEAEMELGSLSHRPGWSELFYGKHQPNWWRNDQSG
jgi:hypothetical protein